MISQYTGRTIAAPVSIPATDTTAAQIRYDVTDADGAAFSFTFLASVPDNAVLSTIDAQAPAGWAAS